MQIFAASFVPESADAFLHAGYISAYPRTLFPDAYPASAQPTLQLDLVEALRLQGESISAGPVLVAPDVVQAPAVIASTHDAAWLVATVLAFFSVLGLVYWQGRRGRPVAKTGGWLAVMGVAAAFALGSLTCAEDEPLPSEKPWEAVPVQSYQDPQAATQAILFGIVAPAVVNVGEPIETLANVQDEVALPASTLSNGQTYALKTYGLDGWGREMRLDNAAPQYTIVSAGADGLFDTGDDVRAGVHQCDNGAWGESRSAYYLRKRGEDVVVMYHRFKGKHFRYNDEQAARSLAGNGLFDAFGDGQLSSEQIASATTAITGYLQNATHEPLVLQVFSL